MIDDFARYSKLQRKINQIDIELSDLQNERLKSSIIVKMVCTYGIRAVFALVLLTFSIYYRQSTVGCLSKKIDLFPLTNVISFPNGKDNCISVPFWITCCTTVGTLLKVHI